MSILSTLLILRYRDESGKAWITFKQRGKKGERGFLKQLPNSDNPNLPNITSTNSLFSLEKVKSNSLIISVINNGLRFKMVAPYQTFDSIHTKSVSSNQIKTGLYYAKKGLVKRVGPKIWDA